MNAFIPHAVPQAPLAAPDADPEETAEWRDAFLALVATQGPERARHLLQELVRLARSQRIGWQPDLNTPYVNTVAVQNQGVFPGDLAIEERVGAIVRWNALAMVVRANQAESGGSSELGGHIASYASAADFFESGFNHFFRAREGVGAGQHCQSWPSRKELRPIIAHCQRFSWPALRTGDFSVLYAESRPIVDISDPSGKSA